MFKYLSMAGNFGKRECQMYTDSIGHFPLSERLNSIDRQIPLLHEKWSAIQFLNYLKDKALGVFLIRIV